MIALEVLIIIFSFGGTVWLSTKVADFHYKYYKGDAPLYFYYAFLFVAIYAAIAFQILCSFPHNCN